MPPDPLNYLSTEYALKMLHSNSMKEMVANCPKSSSLEYGNQFTVYNNYSETCNLIGQQPCRIMQTILHGKF
jgi:hypothetical protein